MHILVSLVSDELQELRQMRDATRLHITQVMNIKPGVRRKKKKTDRLNMSFIKFFITYMYMQDKISKPSASGDKSSVLKSVGAYASSIDVPASNENQVFPKYPKSIKLEALSVWIECSLLTVILDLLSLCAKLCNDNIIINS